MWLRKTTPKFKQNCTTLNTYCSFSLVKHTSELSDEGDHVVLLQDPLQFGLHVLIHVSFKRVLEEDPARSQTVVQPVGRVEHHPTCQAEHREAEGSALIHRTNNSN